MKNISELRAQRTALALDIKQQLDASANDNKFWGSEDQAIYDKKIAEIDNIDLQIKNIQAYLDKFAEDKAEEKIIDKFNSKTKDESARKLYAQYIRQGEKGLTAEDWRTINNTMSVGTSSQGGYTVQSSIAAMLIDYLKLFGGMRSAALVISTEQGNPLNFPQTDGTAEVGEIIGENTTATGQDPSFGTVPVNVYKFSSKVVAVPFELLQDSIIDIEAFVNKRLTQRIGRITNAKYTNGSGTSEPFGIVTQASAGKVGLTGQTVTVIFDDLIDLIHSVDPAYRQQFNLGDGKIDVGFMMADSTLKILRKLKDSSGRPIFLPGYDGLAGAMTDTILGYPIVINQDVPVMAANAKSILYGDFDKYVIRDVMAATLFRFDDSAYAKLGQVGFLMWFRSGGNLLDTTAVKYYQNSAT